MMTRLQRELEHHLSDLENLFLQEDVTDIHLQAGGYVWTGATSVGAVV